MEPTPRDHQHEHRRGVRRGNARWVAALSAVLLAAGLTAIGFGIQHRSSPPQTPADASISAQRQNLGTTPAPSAPAPTGARPATEEVPDSFGPVLTRSRPTRISIPSIGVRTATMVDLALNGDGTLQVPTDFASPGWYTPGPAPGQFGPAVIAGHVDNKSGPAVFYRLGALHQGAKITINRADGTTAHFTVDRVARYPKNQFPTTQVYGNTTNRAELRLITCGGDFNRTTGHYVDNVVAYAHLTS